MGFDYNLQSATALGGTRAMMVLFLSVLILNESLTLWKVCIVPTLPCIGDSEKFSN